MFRTKFGSFDGNSWEDIIQICLKLKYLEEGYQPIPDDGGDHGLEGFTRSGKAFQCYCPDEDYDKKKLYEKQRDKIHDDLQKLVAYESELKNLLGSYKIKTWYLVTPSFSNKDLLKYCQKKVEEYREKKLEILDETFDVQVLDIDTFSRELPVAMGSENIEVDLTLTDRIGEEKIAEWIRNNDNYLVGNAERKHRIKLGKKATTGNIIKATNISVKLFLEGDQMLSILRNDWQRDYDNFEAIRAKFADRAESLCLSFSGENYDTLFEQLNQELSRLIENEFSGRFKWVTRQSLVDFVLHNWLMDCTINFE